MRLTLVLMNKVLQTKLIVVAPKMIFEQYERNEECPTACIVRSIAACFTVQSISVANHEALPAINHPGYILRNTKRSQG